MPTLTDLAALVEKLAVGIPELNLDGDEQEEYSTMLLWLQNQMETGERIRKHSDLRFLPFRESVVHPVLR